MQEQQKQYLKNDLVNDLVKAREEFLRDGYVEDAELVSNAIDRIVLLENSIRELGSLVK